MSSYFSIEIFFPPENDYSHIGILDEMNSEFVP